MTKWLCDCGAVVQSSGPLPHPDGFYLLREERYEERADQPDFDLIAESTLANCCRACGRLWVWWGDAGDPTMYVPEEARWRGT